MKRFDYGAFRREYVRLRRLSVYERVNALADAQTARRRRSAVGWWRSRAMWHDPEPSERPTEAEAFEHLMGECPYHPGDPLTPAEQSEETHFAVTVVRAVLGEMHSVARPSPKPRTGGHKQPTKAAD